MDAKGMRRPFYINLQRLIVVLSLTLFQCSSSKSESSAVLITLTPSVPIVFTGNLQYTNPGGTTVSVTEPWFKFQVNINNTSSQSVTIIGLHIDVTGTDSFGNSNTVSTDFSPENDNFTLTNGSLQIVCQFTDYGQFDPGGYPSGCKTGVAPSVTNGVAQCTDATPAYAPTYNNRSLFETPEGESSECTISSALVNFYAGGNPAPANLNSIQYSVNIVPQGWFGTRTNQQGRFTGTATGYTQ
jgi:hypothetical protein